VRKDNKYIESVLILITVASPNQHTVWAGQNDTLLLAYGSELCQ